MCGIGGFELSGDGDTITARRMLDRLAKRGPDAAWFERAEPYGLVQTRLAVVDLSDGVTYPLRNERGDLRLLFNGEIYGYAQLKTVLTSRGHHFATSCDAEVLVHGYEEWGLDVLARLDGMYSAALFHAPSRELVLLRDPLGIKPMVYTTERNFAFSSDALALVAGGLSEGHIDQDAIADYLAHGYVIPPETGFVGIRQLQPGEILRRSPDGQLATSRPGARPFTSPPRAAPVSGDEVATALDHSVSRQLVADVEVGVFLSAGLDSSLVLDSAVRAGARPIAFTIGFEGYGGFDESRTARRFAAELGVPHVVEQLTIGFLDALDSVGGAFDQPFADPSAIATAALARIAREEVVVALSGTGGDDLFAGYRRHRAHLLRPLVTHLPGFIRGQLASLKVERGNERHSRRAEALSYARRLAAARGEDDLAFYLHLVRTTPSAMTSVSSVRAALSAHTPLTEAFDIANGASSTVRRIQALDVATYLPGDLLTKEDRATMAVGLEGRVPLLGARVLQLAEDATDSAKISPWTGKRLLRQVADARLPSYITRGRKRGFAVPLAAMFAGPWRGPAVDWFSETSSDLVDGRLVGARLRDRRIDAPETWALAALMAWEAETRSARSEARTSSSGSAR